MDFFAVAFSYILFSPFVTIGNMQIAFKFKYFDVVLDTFMLQYEE